MFDGAEIAELMNHHGGAAMFAAPTMVLRLVAHPAVASAGIPGLKTIIYGGGPMYVADLKRAIDVLGPRLSQIYGQGESPMCITSLPKAMITGAHIDRPNGIRCGAPAAAVSSSKI